MICKNKKLSKYLPNQLCLRVGGKVYIMSYPLFMTFDQWDPSTAILKKEECGMQEGQCWKINLI